MSKGPSKLNRPEVSMSSALNPPVRIYRNNLKVPEIPETNSSRVVENDSMPPYTFPLKEYTREILDVRKNSDFYNKTISKFFNKMRSTGVANYYNNGKARNEMNKTGDSKAIIHNKYLSDNKMSRPRVFLEKVKKMKANKFSSNSAAADMSSSFPAGPTYTYNPLAMKITARNVLNEQLRIML